MLKNQEQRLGKLSKSIKQKIQINIKTRRIKTMILHRVFYVQLTQSVLSTVALNSQTSRERVAHIGLLRITIDYNEFQNIIMKYYDFVFELSIIMNN